MRKLIISYILFITPLISILPQVISSEKISIKINNLDVTPGDAGKINQAPQILLVSPEIENGDSLDSDKQKLFVIGRVTDDDKIASVYINATSVKLSEEGFFNEEMLLNNGLNEISVMAVDESNNLSRYTFFVDYSISFRSALELGVEGKYYALIMGVNEYNDPALPFLDNPVKDARSIHDVLTTQYTFEEQNVRLVENPEYNDIIEALDEYSRIITPEDNLLIFYAGHGKWDEDALLGYWLPSDATMQSKKAWFRNSTLQDYLREIKSKHTLLISDACFSGSIFKNRSIMDEAPVAIQKLYDLPSRKAMTSGTLTIVPDESAFIRYLIDRLRENTEKYLSSGQLFNSFRIAVINNSNVVPQFGEIQDVGDEGGDFIFIRRE